MDVLVHTETLQPRLRTAAKSRCNVVMNKNTRTSPVLFLYIVLNLSVEDSYSVYLILFYLPEVG